MFKFLFGSSVVIPTLKLSGIIGQGGMLRAGLTLDSLNKLIESRIESTAAKIDLQVKNG